MKFTIKRKLFLSFGIICILIILFGSYALITMNNMADDTKQVIETAFTKLDIAYSTQVEIAEYRGRQYRHVSLTSLDEMKVIESEMKEMEETVKAHIKEYSEITVNEKDKKLLQELNSAVEEYISVNQKITSLSREGKRNEAEALMIGEALEAYYRLIDKSEEIVVYNGELLSNDYQENARTVDVTTWILFATLITIVVLSVGLSVFISRNISNRLIMMGIGLNQTKDFDLTLDKEMSNGFEKYKSKDELTDAANDLINMRKSLREIVSDIQVASEKVSENAIGITQNINDTSITFEGIAQATDDLAEGSTDQARDAEEAVSKLDNLTRKINLAVENSSHVEEYISEINRANEEGNIAMINLKNAIVDNTNISQEVGLQVEILDKESQSIGKITEAIKSISSQTNLLALNAMIEAARAGESGRGFAVVAEEIRKLAEEVDRNVLSIEDTINNIKSQITKTKDQMEVAKDIIETTKINSNVTGEKLEDISGSIENIVDKLNSLINNIREIDADKNLVITAIQNISAVTEESSAATEEISASVQEQSAIMEEISTSTVELNKIVEEVNNIVNKFKL